MRLFSPKVSADEIVVAMVAGDVHISCEALVQAKTFFADAEKFEFLIGLLSLQNLAWQIAFLQVGGKTVERVQHRVPATYGLIAQRALIEGLSKLGDARAQKVSRIDPYALAQDVFDHTAPLAVTWSHYHDDHLGPGYWVCKRSLQLMGQDENDEVGILFLSAHLTSSIVGATAFTTELASRVKVA